MSSRAAVLLLACVAIVFPVSARGDALSTDRPTVAPTSNVVKRGRFQGEVGGVFGGAVVPMYAAARYGLLDNVELRLSADALNLGVASIRGPSVVAIGAKVEVSGKGGSKLSVLAHGLLETSRSLLGLDVGLVGSASFGNGLGGWAFLSMASSRVVPFSPVFTGSLGLGQGLAMEGRVGAFAELSSVWTPGAGVVPAGTIGLSFNPGDDVQVDAYLMPSFAPVAFVGGLGVSFRI